MKAWIRRLFSFRKRSLTRNPAATIYFRNVPPKFSAVTIVVEEDGTVKGYVDGREVETSVVDGFTMGPKDIR